MMKRFFTVMLGSLAAIWISVGLLMLLGIVWLTTMVAGLAREAAPGKVEPNSILHIDLGTTVAEVNSNADFRGLIEGNGEEVLVLQQAIAAIGHAIDDRNIRGIFIEANPVSGGMASLRALRNAIDEFTSQSGKWVIAYGEQMTQGSYYVASAADKIYLNPQGMVDLHGLTAQVMFYKGLLDKLGVDVQVLKVGTFKSAVEPYILTEISEANRLQIQEYMNPIWADMSGAMAKARGMSVEVLNHLADSLLLTRRAEQLEEAGLIDGTYYYHEMRENLAGRVDCDADDLPLVDIKDYYASVEHKLSKPARRKLAVLYAVGEITEEGPGGIASTTLVPQIEKLAADDDIEGMVLRVNSPGGSAYASEQIWEALQQFKAKGKKLYVSMGDVAASGGYYISCGADRIFASPVTLTGSIGIFGLIPDVKGLLTDKLGITVGTVSTNANGDFPTVLEPMTPFQREQMQRMIDRGYETFVSRCAEGRHVAVDSIKAIAEGRVWAGSTAVEIGLVDSLGTLDDAVKALAESLDLTDYRVEVYPKFKSNIWDVLAQMGSSMEEVALRKLMGSEAYEIYRRARRLDSMEPVQCMMDPVEVSL